MSTEPKSSRASTNSLDVDKPAGAKDDMTLARRDRHRQAIHGRMVRAARSLTEEHQGLHRTTIQEIADLADVARSTFFNHFGTKQGVVPDVARSLIAQRLERALDRTKLGEPVRQVLTDFLKD